MKVKELIKQIEQIKGHIGKKYIRLFLKISELIDRTYLGKTLYYGVCELCHNDELLNSNVCNYKVLYDSISCDISIIVQVER